jgi:HD-like signal output (HDOD) protein
MTDVNRSTGGAGDAESGSPSGIIATLLARMEKDPGFAGLGSSVQTISRLGDDDDEPRDVSSVILRDAALTARLLRLSNSSRNARGGRNVSTIDQAIAILGLNTVKSVALSLALLGSMSNKPQSKQLHAEIVAAYFCGTLACEITRLNSPRYSAQEAQVCGLMQNLGRMMATYYMFEDIEASRVYQSEHNVSEDEAILATLGMGFEAIGAAIVRHWSLPDVLQNSLAPMDAKGPPRSVANALGWHQMCSQFSRRITDILFRMPEGRERIEVSREIETFRLVLKLKEDEVREWIEKSITDTDALLSELSFPCGIEQARVLLRKASERVTDLLSADDSLTKSRNAVGGRTPIEIIQHVLRLIHDKYGFDRTLICLPDGPNRLMAIAGVGRSATQIAGKFRCQGPKVDIFRVIAAKKLDMFIGDVSSPVYAKLMPDWYAELIDAQAFQVLSLVSEGNVVGVLYGDFSTRPAAPPKDLAVGDMKSWRTQLVVALLAGAKKSA